VDLAALRGTAGEARDDILNSIEGLIGSAFAGALSGDAGSNSLIGGRSSDMLSGRLGNDHFIFTRRRRIRSRHHHGFRNHTRDSGYAGAIGNDQRRHRPDGCRRRRPRLPRGPDARSGRQAGAVTSTNGPAEPGALIAAQTQKWRSVARTSNIGVA
jgi:hypothetical protein